MNGFTPKRSLVQKVTPPTPGGFTLETLAPYVAPVRNLEVKPLKDLGTSTSKPKQFSWQPLEKQSWDVKTSAKRDWQQGSNSRSNVPPMKKELISLTLTKKPQDAKPAEKKTSAKTLLKKEMPGEKKKKDHTSRYSENRADSQKPQKTNLSDLSDISEDIEFTDAALDAEIDGMITPPKAKSPISNRKYPWQEEFENVKEGSGKRFLKKFTRGEKKEEAVLEPRNKSNNEDTNSEDSKVSSVATESEIRCQMKQGFQWGSSKPAQSQVDSEPPLNRKAREDKDFRNDLGLVKKQPMKRVETSSKDNQITAEKIRVMSQTLRIQAVKAKIRLMSQTLRNQAAKAVKLVV
ncbi:hypothetical protein WMY93_024831 [Mugilogobius chulae]|uniref:Uncharacterized protein n=1 Tax=Mugilogobius chulae TaxID=88201 RepID=A0AAW0N0T5_9GOBI